VVELRGCGEAFHGHPLYHDRAESVRPARRAFAMRSRPVNNERAAKIGTVAGRAASAASTYRH
jgi:hypothetical protein